MGMFDTFKFKGREWQTKDLACNLDVYEVADDGSVQLLGLDDGTYYPVKDPRLDHLHGIFSACDYLEEEKKLEWVEFKFTDGKMVYFKQLGKA